MNASSISEEQLKELTKVHNRAKVKLMSSSNSVFFTTVLFSLAFVWDNSADCDTAYVDGRELHMNPDFYLQQDDEQKVGLLIHEVGHVIFDHMGRLGKRCPDRWNIAADHAINLMLLERGFRLPKGGLADPQFSGMSAEQIYDLLPDNPGKPKMKDIRGVPMTTEQAAIHKASMDQILLRAAMQSAMSNDQPGTIPGSLQVYLDKLMNPKLPWHRILQKEYSSLYQSDFTWRRPNKRFAPDFYLPSMVGEQFIDLVFFLDASGSVTDKDFTRFVAEIKSVMRMHTPNKVTLIVFDTCIRSITVIKSADELEKMKFHGRGGTDVYDVMRWLEVNKPTMALIFTDGHLHHVEANLKKTKLVWLIHNNPNFRAPYGKVIHYEV